MSFSRLCQAAYTQPTHLIFGSGIDIVSIFYRTKNQVRGLCVGGDMSILFFGDFEVIREKRPPRYILYEIGYTI